MSVTELLALAAGVILTENLVLTRFLGAPALLTDPCRPLTSVGLGLSALFSMTVSCLGTYLLFTLCLAPFGFSYLRIPVSALTALGALYLLRELLRRFAVPLYLALRDDLPLLGVGCAAFGVTLLSTGEPHGLLPTLLFGVFSGLGYILTLLLFQCLKERLVFSDCPKSFEGPPLFLLTLGLLAMAFTGFTGLDLW